MNFFGHAAIASWQSSEPGFVLGAMLPDFAAMIGARPPRATLALVERGVAFHHVTDHAFHDAPSFRRLTTSAMAELAELGLARGAARATAHVGIEILIDGVLARESAARRAYLEALSFAPGLDRETLIWNQPDAHERFASLIEALAERGVSVEHSAPEIVALRVERALAPRRLLALGTGDRERVARWAERAAPVVDATTGGLLEEIAARLRAGSGERDVPP